VFQQCKYSQEVSDLWIAEIDLATREPLIDIGTGFGINHIVSANDAGL
jgi:hypothetical protein